MEATKQKNARRAKTRKVNARRARAKRARAKRAREEGLQKNKWTSPWSKYALTECINHLPDTNFWHYALQLNTYKALLEKNYGKTVSKMALVCLHPNQTRYQVIAVANLQNEVRDLFELRKTTMVS